jgi:hypothetical protein
MTVTRWNPKFDDLPEIRVPSMPRYDGDMAELDELADRIFTYPPAQVARLQRRYIYHLVQDEKGIYPGQLLRNWDAAAELLRRWRRG